MATASAHTLIAGGLVLAPASQPARPADILIEGDTIRALLAPGEAAPEGCARIEAQGMLVIPGLINAHTHGHGGLSKGSGDRWSLELLLNAGGWLGGHRSADDRYLSTLLAAIEMLKKGCTACFDLSLAVPVPTAEGMAAAAQAYMDAGMRAVVAPMVGDIPFYRALPGLIEAAPAELRRDMERAAASDGATLLAAIEAIARAWPFPADRVRFGVAPTIPLHSTDAFLCGCGRIARDHGLPFQTHLAESRVQAVTARGRYGCSITEHVHALDLIGPGFSGAHGVWLNRHDMALLAERGAAVAHNPTSNLRLGSGVADARALIDHGVAVGIGTDGGASADGQNMFEAARLACNLSRVQSRAPDRWLSVAETIGLATEGSARVLGMQDRIGRIAPGFKADLVFLDLAHINYVPLNDAANQLVHVEDGSAVRRVMVGGRTVVQDGAVMGIDFAAVTARAQEAAERLRRANAPARAFAERLEPFVAQFCHALGRQPWSADGEGERRLGGDP